jgi:hypothetical protein
MVSSSATVHPAAVEGAEQVWQRAVRAYSWSELAKKPPPPLQAELPRSGLRGQKLPPLAAVTVARAQTATSALPTSTVATVAKSKAVTTVAKSKALTTVAKSKAHGRPHISVADLPGQLAQRNLIPHASTQSYTCPWCMHTAANLSSIHTHCAVSHPQHLVQRIPTVHPSSWRRNIAAPAVVAGAALSGLYYRLYFMCEAGADRAADWGDETRRLKTRLRKRCTCENLQEAYLDAADAFFKGVSRLLHWLLPCLGSAVSTAKDGRRAAQRWVDTSYPNT